MKAQFFDQYMRANQPLLARLPVWRRTVVSEQVGEAAAVARFAVWVNQLPTLELPSPALRVSMLAAVREVARHIETGAETGSPVRYTRRVLADDPGRWTLAVVALRPGQQTEAHDHGGWGCAVTAQGIERDRRFRPDESGQLALISERDYLPGAGYTFTPSDIHQPYGAHPSQVTVALHFLVEGSHQAHAEHH